MLAGLGAGVGHASANHETLSLTDGLVMQLDATDIDATDGDAVGTWADASGNGNDATQSTSSARPTYDDTALAGNPALVFDGSDDWLDIPDTMTTVDDCTVFIVGQHTGKLGAETYMLSGTTGTDDRLRMASFGWAGNYAWGAGDVGALTGGYEDLAPHVFGMTSSIDAYLDGTLVGSATNSAGSATPDNLNLASFGEGSRSFFQGHISEVLVYNRELSSSEIDEVNQHLTEKWDILPVRDGLVCQVTANDIDLADGDLVSSWEDISNHGNGFSQSDSTVQPTFVENSLFGAEAVKFDGSSTWLDGPTDIVTADDFTCFVVAKFDDLGYGDTLISGYDSTDQARFRISVPDWDTSFNYCAGDQSPNYDAGTHNTAPQDEQPHVHAFDSDLNAWIEGRQLTKESSISNGSTGAPDLALGVYEDGMKNYFDGKVEEVLVFDRQLSSSEVDAVNAHLVEKHDSVAKFTPWDTEPMDTQVKTVDNEKVLYQYGQPVASYENWRLDEPARDFADLDGTWKFKWGIDGWNPDEIGVEHGWYQPGHDDSNWQTVDVPGCWDLYDTPHFGDMDLDESKWNTGTDTRDGYGWFRKTVSVPSDWDGKAVRVHFMGAAYRKRVWVNGTEVGVHEGRTAPFSLDISDQLQPGQDNVIAVRCYRRPDFTTYELNTDKHKLVNHEASPSQPTDGWPYAGLFRSVYLEATDQVAVMNLITDAQNGTLDAQAVLYNYSSTKQKRKVTINPGSGTGGKSQSTTVSVGAGSTKVVSMSIDIPDAKQWDLDSPTTYEASAELFTSGSVTDRLTTTYGMRTMVVDNAEVKLNGEPVFLKGLNWYEETDTTGHIPTEDLIDQELQHVLDLGCNFLRQSAHRHPRVYEWANENGVLTMQSAPTAWMGDGAQARQIEYGLSRALSQQMVWFEQNHPSIMGWLLHNEIPEGDNYLEFHSDIQNAVEELDRNDEFVSITTQSSNNEAYDQVDVLGYNEYYGYFYGNSKDLSPKLEEMHNNYPNKPIIILENGTYSGPPSRSDDTLDPASQGGSPEWQSTYFQAHWNQVTRADKRTFVSGHTWFSLKDYKTRAGYNWGGPNAISSTGAIWFDERDTTMVYDRIKNAPNPNTVDAPTYPITEGSGATMYDSTGNADGTIDGATWDTDSDTPGGLPVTSGLVSNLDASEISASDGDSISTWSDISDNGNDATQSTASAQPTYDSTGLDGDPALVFDGSDDWLDLPDSMVTVDDCTVFVVGQHTGNFDSDSYLLSGQSGSNDNRLRMASWGWTSDFVWGAGDAGALRAGTEDSDPHVFGLTSGLAAYVDGTKVGSATNSAGANTPGNLNLGSYGEGSRDFFQGAVSKVLVYNRELTSDEITAVNDYLQSKEYLQKNEDTILRFDGSDTVETDAAAISDTGGYSQRYQVYLDDTSTDRALTGDWGQDGTHTLYYNATTDSLEIRLTDRRGNVVEVLDTGTSPPVNEWFTVGWSFDSAFYSGDDPETYGKLKLFQNGTLIGSTAGTGFPLATSSTREIGGDYGAHAGWSGAIHEIDEWHFVQLDSFF